MIRVGRVEAGPLETDGEERRVSIARGRISVIGGVLLCSAALVAVGDANARGLDRRNEASRSVTRRDVRNSAPSTAVGRRAATELAKEILNAVRVTHGTSGVSLHAIRLHKRHTLTMWSLATPSDDTTWGAYRLRIVTQRGALIEASATTYAQSTPLVLSRGPQGEDFHEVAFRSGSRGGQATWLIAEQDREQILTCPPGSPELCPNAAVGGAQVFPADEPKEVESYLQETQETVTDAIHHVTI